MDWCRACPEPSSKWWGLFCEITGLSGERLKQEGWASPSAAPSRRKGKGLSPDRIPGDSQASVDAQLASELIRKKSRLVHDLTEFIAQYVVMTRAQLLVVALWAIHTHCLDSAEQTPYLTVTSPEKQCGKTRLQEVLEHVVARPWRVLTPSEAVLYAAISKKAFAAGAEIQRRSGFTPAATVCRAGCRLYGNRRARRYSRRWREQAGYCRDWLGGASAALH